MNHELPAWMLDRLGIAPHGPGEGTLWRWEHAWPLPPWATLLLVVALGSLVVWLYAREANRAARLLRVGLAALRLAALGCVLLMLAELVLGLKRTGLPYVAVLIDDSASMGTVDQYSAEELSAAQRLLSAGGQSTASRLELAKSLLLQEDSRWINELASRYKLKWYFVSATARAQPDSPTELAESLQNLTATGATSRLGAAVRSVLGDLRGAPPAALILFSDGVNTEGETLEEAAALARRKGVPVYTVAIGHERPALDIELSDLLVDDVVFVDDVVQFEFSVTARGFAGRTLEATLRTVDTEEPLARIPVEIEEDGAHQRVVLPYRPAVEGEFEFVVEIPADPAELRSDNNRLSQIVTVRKERLRVLLVQSYPSWEFRYLKHLLERDATIEVNVVLQEADVDYAQIDASALPVFPVRREDVFAYDVIMLGDVNPALLNRSSLEHLSEFVQEQGGGLVVCAGPRHMPYDYRDSPLDALLPVNIASVVAPDPDASLSESFQVQPTPLGLASPMLQLGDTVQESARIWSRLPSLYWLCAANQLRPSAQVLAEHPTQMTDPLQALNGSSSAAPSQPRLLPVLVFQYAGAGKVLFSATDETWRWRYRVGDVFLSRFWIQTIRYLSRGKLLGQDRSALLTSDRREYALGETVALRVRFLDERQAPADERGVTVTIERVGQPVRRETLTRTGAHRGVFEAALQNLPVGDYHAWLSSPTLEGKPPGVDFRVVAPPGERQRIEADIAALRRVSELTRGRSYSWHSAEKMLGELPVGRQVPLESLPPLELWSSPWLLGVLLALLVTEWYGRRRAGML